MNALDRILAEEAAAVARRSSPSSSSTGSPRLAELLRRAGVHVVIARRSIRLRRQTGGRGRTLRTGFSLDDWCGTEPAADRVFCAMLTNLAVDLPVASRGSRAVPRHRALLRLLGADAPALVEAAEIETGLDLSAILRPDPPAAVFPP